MQKTDIRELRKKLSKAVQQGGLIDWIYGLYVSADNQVEWECLRRFHNLSEEEQFRHADILMKTLPSAIGRNLNAVRTERNEYLLELRKLETDAENAEEAMKELKELLGAHFHHTDPYYATLMKIHLDVPARASDGAYIEDGGSVYEALVLSVCPAKLSAPALGYSDGGVGELSRRWTVGAPAAGFLYPSFDERAEDRNEAALFSKKDCGQTLFGAIFKFEAKPATQEEIREEWTSLMESVGMDLNKTCTFNNLIMEKRGESEAPTADGKTLRKLAEAAGCDGEGFEERYREVFSDAEVPFELITEPKCRITTDSARVQIPAEQAEFVRIEEVDGVPYLLVPLDGQVRVNGIAIGE